MSDLRFEITNAETSHRLAGKIVVGPHAVALYLDGWLHACPVIMLRVRRGIDAPLVGVTTSGDARNPYVTPLCPAEGLCLSPLSAIADAVTSDEPAT